MKMFPNLRIFPCVQPVRVAGCGPTIRVLQLRGASEGQIYPVEVLICRWRVSRTVIHPTSPENHRWQVEYRAARPPDNTNSVQHWHHSSDRKWGKLISAIINPHRGGQNRARCGYPSANYPELRQ